jgi:sugar phosphate isomerase/epimerase
MNPRWVGPSGLDAFLDPLRQVGLEALEFELDRFLPEWEPMESLIGECSNAGMKLSFHAPYRAPNHLDGFSSGQSEDIIGYYQPMLAIAQHWADKQKTPVNVVIHGARSSNRSREALREDTLQFLAWALSRFPGIYFAFENNHPPKEGEIKIGDTRANVLDIVDTLDHPNLGVCWDFGHDFLSGDGHEVDSRWLSKLIHAHVHDVDEQGVDHYPLVYQNVPYSSWLPLLQSANRLRVITLEIKGGLMKGWSTQKIQTALIDSITTIKLGIG